MALKNKVFFISLFFFNLLFSQNKRCASVEVLKRRLKDYNIEFSKFKIDESIKNYDLIKHQKKRINDSVVVIPVVVHVVWNHFDQNISEEQIFSQIDVINRDFRKQNNDSLNNDHPFQSYSSDVKIQFCLAKSDPNGNPTNGITRTRTDSLFFRSFRSEKFSKLGGRDAWDTKKYLNIWVCNFDKTDEILGYATFPFDFNKFPHEDGVVISYKAFGTLGTAEAPNNLGRTATHEIGHWLNLHHIWGDDECGDDFVIDTPKAKEPNYGCPDYPHNVMSCNSNQLGEMYMNYMDYVNDKCMCMFTKGQKERMRNTLFTKRFSIISSNLCSDIKEKEDISKFFTIFPNPTDGFFTITVSGLDTLKGNEERYKKNVGIKIKNLLGIEIFDYGVSNQLPFSAHINKSFLNGFYIVEIIFHESDNELVSKILIVDQ